LTACAGHQWGDRDTTPAKTTPTTTTNSGSSVQVYGIMDGGVGVQRMSR
jgi:hypothetical protein